MTYIELRERLLCCKEWGVSFSALILQWSTPAEPPTHIRVYHASYIMWAGASFELTCALMPAVPAASETAMSCCGTSDCLLAILSGQSALCMEPQRRFGVMALQSCSRGQCQHPYNSILMYNACRGYDSITRLTAGTVY